MSSKKFLTELLTFYIMSLLSCSLVFAQPECTFFNSDIEGVEVGQIGDRKIYTLFTRHLSGQDNEISAIINSYTLIDAVAPLSEFLKDHREIIESERSDVQKITELIASGKIDWIGVEYYKTGAVDIDEMVDHYSEAQSEIDKEWNHLQEWDSSKTDQLLSLSYNTFVIVRGNHPEIFQRVRIYPLEDESLSMRGLNRLDTYLYLVDVLKEDIRVTPDQYSRVLSFIDETVTANPQLISENEFEAFLNRIEVPEEARLNMRVLMRVHNDIVSLASRRDAAIVQSILDLPGNGLLLFGTGHSYGIKQGLITACQNGNDSPR